VESDESDDDEYHGRLDELDLRNRSIRKSDPSAHIIRRKESHYRPWYKPHSSFFQIIGAYIAILIVIYILH